MRKIACLAFIFATISILVSCVNTTESTASSTTDAVTNPTTTSETTTEETTTVFEPVFTFANGIYDFSDASNELRLTFVATAEQYLLDNMYGGIPLVTRANHIVFSSRMTLPTETYVHVLEFGQRYGSLSLDDSNVLMADGELGEVGEYTYRMTQPIGIYSYNSWTIDDSVTEEIMSNCYDNLYRFEINENQNGYDLVPSMAASLPLAMNPDTDSTGKVISNKWRVTLRDDLEWFFHPDTDEDFLNTLSNEDYEIDAVDFLDTYRLALEEEFFRAVSGGMDMVNSFYLVEGAWEYYYEDGSLDDIGIVIVEDGNNLTLEFSFVEELSEWDIMYWLSDTFKSPINIDLYDYLCYDDGDLTTYYGNDGESISYTGPFYVFSETEELIELKSNPDYFNGDLYSYTGYEISICDDEEEIQTMYDNGYLDVLRLGSGDYSSYTEGHTLVNIPSSSVLRLNINGLGTVENQRSVFPDSTWIPEPILAETDFRMAMFFAIDRVELAQTMGSYVPMDRYYGSNYVMNYDDRVPYRYSETGMSVGADLSPSTYGYDFDKARELYESVIDKLIEDGIYSAGTIDDPTIIELKLEILDSPTQIAMAEALEDAFESAFQSSEYHVNVDLNWTINQFPYIYYDVLMIGEFDLGIGALSEQFNTLETYRSDNSSGFTINWGFDTNIPEIEVAYTGMDGEMKYEIWSFDAIDSALRHSTCVLDGYESAFPQPVVLDTTATTISFEIEGYENELVENITYTILIYDYLSDEYFELDGYVDIVAETPIITVEGMTPYYYWYTIDEEILYQSGDYIIRVDYDYVNDDLSGSSSTYWVTMDTVLEDSVTNGYANTYMATPTSIDGLVINPTADYEDVAIVEIIVTDYDWNDITASVNLDANDLNNVSFDSLDSDSRYILWITFEDGMTDAIRVRTNPVIEDYEIVETVDGALLGIVLDESDGVTRTVTDITVYRMEDDLEMTEAIIDYQDLENISITYIYSGTDYYIVFTFSDGNTETIEFSTET